jgi:hypothetical protein
MSGSLYATRSARWPRQCDKLCLKLHRYANLKKR